MQIHQIALQLYTLRDFIKTPQEIAETLKRVRAIGYEAVQVSGMGAIPEKDLRAICDREGLTICATHEPSNQILSDPSAVVDRLGKLGCTYTAYPYPVDIDFANRADVEKLVRGLDAAGSVLQGAGPTLLYHNHAREFVRFENTTILDHLYNSISAENLAAELDTYWVQFGGGSPVEWCRRISGRLPVLHCKDYTIIAPNTPSFAEVGSGNLNWNGILSAAEDAGCEWYVVEQDSCLGDPFDAVETSFRYLKAYCDGARLIA